MTDEELKQKIAALRELMNDPELPPLDTLDKGQHWDHLSSPTQILITKLLWIRNCLPCLLDALEAQEISISDLAERLDRAVNELKLREIFDEPLTND